MLKLYRLLLVFFVLIGCEFYCLQAQVKENYPFQHIRNGIPQNSATVIFEDSYGFLWIGTPNGINKYNGTDFELFNKAQNSTANDYVYAICEVQSNLYIGTNNGLHLYNREINRISPVEFKGDAKILEVKNYRTLAQTDSLLWLGSYSHGLFLVQAFPF